MKTGTAILLGLGGLLAYDLYKQSQAADLLTYSLLNVGYDASNTNALQTSLNVAINISNLTQTTIYLIKVTGTIFYNGQSLASIDTGTSIIVIRPGNNALTFNALVNNVGVVAEVIALLTGNNGSTAGLTFTGTIFTPFTNVALQQSIGGVGRKGIHGPAAVKPVQHQFFCFSDY